MNLQLQKIYFKNWKCYKEQTIKFSLDLKTNVYNKKNVLVIYGKNGAGKTSLQEGILWCLYGEDAISRQKLDRCFNRINVQTNPQLELLVQLTFTDSQHIYDIQRVAKRVKRGLAFFSEVKEANFYKDNILKQDARERIETLLPRSCREFFFFDGTKIKEYAKLTHTEETRQAIERTLGIPELRNLRDDAEGAVQKFKTQLKDATKTSQKLQKVIGELALVQQEHISKQTQIEKYQEDLKQEEKFLKDAELRGSEIEELVTKQEQIKKDEKQKQDWDKKVKELDSTIATAIQNSPISILSELIRETKDDIQSKAITKTRLSVNVNLLKELINEKNCVCGRCIDDDARFYLQQEINSLEQNNQASKEAIELQEIYSDLQNLTKFQLLDLNNLLQRRNIIQEDIDEIAQKIKRIQQETQDFDTQEAKKNWQQQGQAKEKINNLKESIERIRQENQILQQKAKQLKSQREQLANQNKSTATLNKQLILAEKLQQATDELINWHIDNRRQTIEKETSKIHRQIINKPDEYTGVQVKSDYTLEINHVNEYSIIPEDISDGEKEALAFSFIVGLNLASNTAALLMMDTPFGNLDSEHQQNIIKSIAKIPSQVILLATDRDLPDNLYQELKPYIAQTHKVSRLNGSEDTSIVEVVE